MNTLQQLLKKSLIQLNLEKVDHLEPTDCDILAAKVEDIIINKVDEDVSEESSDFIGPRLPKLMTESERKAFFKELLA